MFKYLLIFALIFVGSFSLQGVTDLTDANWASELSGNTDEPSFWIVMFAADWCGHCQRLKPEFEKLSVDLQEQGVKLGLVTDKNNGLIDKYVVNHETHMVSYPKVKVFLGEELMGDVPPGLRTAAEIKSWFLKQYGLNEQEL